MATRPLWNGTSRVTVDNNAITALLNQFTFRARVGSAPDTANSNIDNTTFEAKAGVTYTIHYDVRKFGAGLEAGTPTEGRIFAFNADLNNDATTSTVFDSGDLIAGNALPRTGNVSFTPAQSGTYRLCTWMRRVGNPSQGDWSVHCDGAATFGTLSNPVRAVSQDKGRLRSGHDISTLTITERGNAAPAKFAVAMNAGGTALQESVRIESVQDKVQNQSVANVNCYTFKQRRNGTSTFDVSTTTSIQSTTTQRTETVVDRLSYPNEGVNQSYDSQILIEVNSLLHTNNTPQYLALAGQLADGVWVYFTAVGAGLSLTDYKTVTKLASHNVDAGGTVENVGTYSAAIYAEDANGIPTVAEKFGFIFTDDNMVVKSGRVLNSRSEAMFGVFVVGEVVHEASGQNLVTWGNNDANFKTRTNGWQLTARTVTVTTPPAGVYKVTSTAVFPGTAFGTIALRTFSAVRIEQGSPASATTGKDWIAPASFSTAWICGEEPMQGGSTKTITIAVFNKNLSGDMVYQNADFTPTIYLGKRNLITGVIADLTSPIATNIATGQYQFTFTPDVVATGTKDVYLIAADVTVGSFRRRWAENVTAVSYNIVSDPDIRVLSSFRPQVDGQHFQPGLSAMGSLAVMTDTTNRFIQPDTGTTKICFLLRGTGVDAGYVSFLDSDMVWKRVTTIADLYFWPMTEAVAGGLVYIKTFTALETSVWALGSVSVVGQCKVNGIGYGTPFVGFAQSPYNSHITPDDISTGTTGQLPEARVTFGDAGHQHTGGTDGRAIGDRS